MDPITLTEGMPEPGSQPSMASSPSLLVELQGSHSKLASLGSWILFFFPFLKTKAFIVCPHREGWDGVWGSLQSERAQSPGAGLCLHSRALRLPVGLLAAFLCPPPPPEPQSPSLLQTALPWELSIDWQLHIMTPPPGWASGRG